MSCPHGLFDVCCNDEDNCTLGTSPKRDWVGLTDEDVDWVYHKPWKDMYVFARHIEAKLKEKNT